MKFLNIEYYTKLRKCTIPYNRDEIKLNEDFFLKLLRQNNNFS